MKISSSSWHYRWLEFFGLEGRDSGNICGYLRSLLITAPLLTAFMTFIAVFILLMAVGTAWAAADMLAWIAWMLVNLELIEPAIFTNPLFTLGYAVLIATAVFGLGRGPTRIMAESELVQAAWDRVHGKICAQVELT